MARRSKPSPWPRRKKAGLQGRFGEYCWEVEDGASSTLDVTPLIGSTKVRDELSLAARRAESFLSQNRAALHSIGAHGHASTARGRVEVTLTTSNAIGAVPLISPVTGRTDYGLVVRPRYGWSSAGEVLGRTGLAVAPQLLPMPTIPRSERRVPAWVLSSVVLARVHAMLSGLHPRFSLVEAERRAPRGSVDWRRYAVTSLARGRADRVPCRFPDLGEDTRLLGALHFVLAAHYAALVTQRTQAPFVRNLVELCEQLRAQVAHVPARCPSNDNVFEWQHRPTSTRTFIEGIEAIEWTAEERGLAGLSSASGLPWKLDMQELFEAWVVEVTRSLSRRVGGTVVLGRDGRSRRRMLWEPPFAGSQSSLLPDVVLDRGDTVVVLDAKYKRHLEELDFVGWRNISEQVRESHREDLLQVLAYSSLFDAERIVAVLVYPCHAETFESLKKRRLLVRRARIQGIPRRIEVALAAAPMAARPEEIAEHLVPLVSPDRPGSDAA